MSIGDCAVCRELIDAARLSIKLHLEATASLIQAVQSGMPEGEYSTLKDRAETCSRVREEAVSAYRTHLAGHDTKVMTAGSSPES